MRNYHVVLGFLGEYPETGNQEWKFQLFYWDYAIGVFLLSLVLALTMGSTGSSGQGFAANLSAADGNNILMALLGGVIFNLSNILLVGAIAVAGLAVAFPVGVGLALVIGVISNYLAAPVGNSVLLFGGVCCVALAIIIDALAYKKLSNQDSKNPGQRYSAFRNRGYFDGVLLSFCGGFDVNRFH